MDGTTYWISRVPGRLFCLFNGIVNVVIFKFKKKVAESFLQPSKNLKEVAEKNSRVPAYQVLS